MFSVGNKEKTFKSFLLKELFGILCLICFILDKPAKKYFIVKHEECYRGGNVHSEFDTWRSSKLVCSTGNGHKIGQSLVFNLDLRWRPVRDAPSHWAGLELLQRSFCLRSGIQKDSIGKESPAQRAESQEEMCRLLCPEHPTLWSQRQESRAQGGEPRTFPSICCAHLQPILGWLGRGHDFPRSS